MRLNCQPLLRDTRPDQCALSVSCSRGLGFTLLELLLTLSITGVVLSAGVFLLVATDRGTSNDQDHRAFVVRSKVVQDRLDAAVRSSRTLLAYGDDFIVLWVGDTREDGGPNISELKRIEFDESGGRMICHAGAATLSQSEDTQYDLATTDFDTETVKLIGTSVFPREVWGKGVASFQASPNVANPRDARVISYRLDVDSGGNIETVRGSMALRGVWN